MTGRFRRAIRIHAEAGRAVAEVEDDFHHFIVTVLHAEGAVTDARGQAIRYPWSQCPMAGAALAGLKGLAIGLDATAVYRHADPLGQCTHMLELAALAISQAARGPGVRRYDVEANDPVDGRVTVDLSRDGRPFGRWVLHDGLIVEPAALAGQRPAALRSSMLRELPPQDAETTLILRRAVHLAGARGLDVDKFPNAAAMNRAPACYVFRPGVAEQAARRYGSVRDFSAGPGPLAEPSGGPR